MYQEHFDYKYNYKFTVFETIFKKRKKNCNQFKQIKRYNKRTHSRTNSLNVDYNIGNLVKIKNTNTLNNMPKTIINVICIKVMKK